MFMIFNNNDCYPKWIHIHLNLNFFLLKNYLFFFKYKYKIKFQSTIIYYNSIIYSYFLSIHSSYQEPMISYRKYIKVLIKLKLN
jgi:hypothetical protein